MYRAIFLNLVLLLAIPAFSQTKPKQKEKPPTQKELADIMKEMQAELDGMSPEDKRMMDSMGIKVPSMKDLPKFSDKQIAEAWENESRLVPQKDAVRIAAIPKAVTDSKMGEYIVAVQTKLETVLKPAVMTAANDMYAYIQSNSKNPEEAANMAIGLWLQGYTEPALYILGKICASNPRNFDNLSNYAAILSMQGAQHLAIPILNNLNQKFSKNSTLLNNLGQAWFGLGEIGKAEKYLDSAIRIYAYHPQASLTKSLIEENKGNKQKAIEAATRSIAKAYSMEKENRLNKLGYKLQPNDLAWDRPMPMDALGLEKFKWPDYPMNVAESQQLEKEWDAFKRACEEELGRLKAQEAILEKEAAHANEVRTKQLLQAGQRGVRVDPIPPFAPKAIAKLGHLVDDRDGHLSFSFQKKAEAISNAMLEVAKFDEILSNQVRALEKTYEDQFGEGKPNPFDAVCADDTKAKNSFLNSSNWLLRDAYNDFLQFMRRKINNETYYNQYTMWPENFELAKVQAKISWLGMIHAQNPKFQDKGPWCPDRKDPEPAKFKLVEFDDINCEYKSSLNMGCIKMVTNCGQTITTYGCGKISFTERELGQNYTGGTLKVSPKIGGNVNVGPLSVEGSIGADLTFELDEKNRVKEWEGKVTTTVGVGAGIHTGPVKVGASVSESLEVEIGSNGISDINIVSSAKVGAAIAAPKSPGDQEVDDLLNRGSGYVNKGVGKLNTQVKLGVECRTSLLSWHGSVDGTGALSGVKLSGW